MGQLIAFSCDWVLTALVVLAVVVFCSLWEKK